MDSEEKRFLESVKEDISESTENSSQKIEYFLIGLSVAAVAVSVLIFGLISSKQSQISLIDARIQEEVTTPLMNMDDEYNQVLAVSKQLDILQMALSSRIDHDQIIKDLASNTFKQTRWIALDYSDKGIVLSGVADDYVAVAKSVAYLKNLNSATDVKLTAANIDKEDELIEYTVELILDTSKYSMNVPTSQTNNTGVINGQTK